MRYRHAPGALVLTLLCACAPAIAAASSMMPGAMAATVAPHAKPASHAKPAAAAKPAAPAAAVTPATPAVAPPDSAPPRLSTDVVPTAESVELRLDPDSAGYRGRVTIALDVRQSARELRFHTRALTIDRATLTAGGRDVAVAAIRRLAPDQSVVRAAEPLMPGACTLVLDFHNDYDTHAIALYKVVTGGASYLFTQFEDTEAREAFPCWDEPAFKIPWQVTLTVPKGDLAVSNTPIAKETPDGALRRVEFRRTRPLPSYLIAIAVGPFETVPIAGMSVPGRVVTVRGGSRMAAEAVRATPLIMHSLEKYFGRRYPYEKLDLIAAPEFLYGAMENAGAIVFADRRLLVDPASTSPQDRRILTSIIAHEMAHMWFGDYVTMAWWDDLWLNESFASWMAAKVVRDVYPAAGSYVSELQSVERAMQTDARPSTRQIRLPVLGATSLGQTANELTYNKGQAVLTMFEGWVGAETFRKGVLRYLDAHAWGNARGSDLWNAIGAVAGQDLTPAMQSFLDQPGVPLVTVEPLDGGRVRLSQKRFLTFGDAPATTWRIPVILRAGGPSGARTVRVWLAAPDTVADLGARATWIAPNSNGSGYYRWSVPDPMLDAMIAARAQLAPRERVDLIANLEALLRSGAVHADRWLSYMSTLADDPDPGIVASAVEAMNDVRIPLTPDAGDDMMAGWLRASLRPTLARIGAMPRAGESEPATNVRPALLRLLADGGHDPGAIALAESLGRAYRARATSIPPSLVEYATIVGAYRGDRALFDDYRRRFETATVPSERPMYLAGLGSFRDPALQQAALDYSLAAPLRPQEGLVIPSAMGLNVTGNEGRNGGGIFSDAVAQWMMDHMEELQRRMPPNFAARVLALGGGCSRDRVDQLRAFLSNPAHQVRGGEFTMKRLGESIDECAALHDREAPTAKRWLEVHAGRP